MNRGYGDGYEEEDVCDRRYPPNIVGCMRGAATLLEDVYLGR